MLKLIAATTFFATNAAPLLTPAPLAATLPYLKSATLQTLDGENVKFQAEELWQRNGALIYAARRAGCPLCRAAAKDISSLRPELEDRKVDLYAVVHEDLHVEKFQEYFNGEIFLDVDKTFFGPVQRWQHGLGFFSVLSCFYAWKALVRKIPGEKDGEGRLLGATFLLGPGEQGVLFQHNEYLAGNEANLEEIRKALEKVQLPD